MKGTGRCASLSRVAGRSGGVSAGAASLVEDDAGAERVVVRSCRASASASNGVTARSLGYGGSALRRAASGGALYRPLARGALGCPFGVLAGRRAGPAWGELFARVDRGIERASAGGVGAVADGPAGDDSRPPGPRAPTGLERPRRPL